MANETLPMMPWFPRDFLAATRGWRMVEVGVYRSLLDAQWDLGSLPIDETALRKVISSDVKEFKKGWKKCADKFPIHGPCRLNMKLEKHRQEAIRLRDLRADGAAKTNAKRRTLSESHSGTLSDAQSGTHPSPSPSPSPFKKNPKSENPLETGFERRKSREIAARLPGVAELVERFKS